MSAGIEVKLDTAKMVLAAQTIRNQMSIVNNCFMTIKEEALGLKGNCWEGESADAYYENMKKLCDEQSKQDAVSTGFIVKTLDDYIQNLHLTSSSFTVSEKKLEAMMEALPTDVFEV